MDEKVMKRAQAGAKFLDERLGRGWWRRIKLRRLDLSMAYMRPGRCGCILAQLDAYDWGDGSYLRKCEELGLSEQRRVRMGFAAPRYGSYPELTEAWKQIVRERRTPAATR